MNEIRQLIKASDAGAKKIDFESTESGTFLNVSEFFTDTIQGENFVGFPATFLRLQGCVLNCSYCDTKKIWKKGGSYSFKELFQLMEQFNVIKQFNVISKLKDGQHLVITGGSPLMQQNSLLKFLQEFRSTYQFIPYIEIENECIIEPSIELLPFIQRWNNSPKLPNCEVAAHKWYIPSVIRSMANLPNSWFKFVINSNEDWDLIEALYLKPGLIHKRHIVLMPMGDTREEVFKNSKTTVNMVIRHNVRYSTREHIVLWDNQIGV